MSPRAAWRLERFGYDPVYDYSVGKVDWLAAGLPTEGTGDRSGRVGNVMDRSVPTCGPDDGVTDVVARVGPQLCIVVNERGIVLGRLRLDRLADGEARTAEDVMEPGPATVRANEDLAETLERMRTRKVGSLIVSTPEGVLLGVVHADGNEPPTG
jgi:CBS domain-containing protein